MSAWGTETWWPLPEPAFRGVFVPHGFGKYAAGWCRCEVCREECDKAWARFLANRKGAL